MALVRPGQFDAWWLQGETHCFYCLDPIDRARLAICWSGSRLILLHVDCAANLAGKLLADSLDAATRAPAGDEGRPPCS